MGIYSTDVTTYPQTQAQWDADPRILPPNVVAVVTDGANIGRKKWFDDVHTFAELDYTDAASGGGITALTGDVTASGSGSVAATLASVGPGAGAIAYPASITLDAKGRVTDATAGTPPAIPLDARWAQILNAGSTSAGEVEANSDADATAVTSITFHKLDAGANDQSAWFTQMRIGGNLTVRMTNNDGTNASGTPVVYRITAVPTLASDRYTIAVAYVSGQFVGSLPYWYVSYAYNEAKEYVAVAFGGGGTNAPIVTAPGYVLKDDFGGITFTRSDVGLYVINKVGAFPASKLWGGSGSTNTNGYVWSIDRGSDDTLTFRVFNLSGSLAELADDDSAHIQFKVYP